MASHIRGNLTEEQLERIEANRKRALERLQQKKKKDAGEHVPSSTPKSTSTTTTKETGSYSPTKTLSQIFNSDSVQVLSKFVEIETDGSVKKRRVLTEEQRQKIEQNRLRAIEIQKNLKQRENQKDDSTTSSKPVDNIRLNQNRPDSVVSSTKKFQPPPIRKQDYIEFDFATMKDTKGGFLQDEKTNTQGADEQTLQDWKNKQRELQKIRELPPPIDLQNIPRCRECQSMEVDANLMTNFNVRACRKCIKALPEKYSLLTKTECKEDYLLTEPELQDTTLLPRIEKPNPHGYSRMQLFVRFQVEEFAWKKWGGPEELDKEWERREENKVKRKEKKYHDQLREMRKRTRAEEYTRKLRDGKSLGERHVHDWSSPVNIDKHTIKRRCIDCGIETEEVVI